MKGNTPSTSYGIYLSVLWKVTLSIYAIRRVPDTTPRFTETYLARQKSLRAVLPMNVN